MASKSMNLQSEKFTSLLLKKTIRKLSDRSSVRLAMTSKFGLNCSTIFKEKALKCFEKAKKSEEDLKQANHHDILALGEETARKVAKEKREQIVAIIRYSNFQESPATVAIIEKCLKLAGMHEKHAAALKILTSENFPDNCEI